MGSQRLDFAEFYRRARDECLRPVLVSVGDYDAAQELVDEAFARACAAPLVIVIGPESATRGAESAYRWRMHGRYDDGRTGLCHIYDASTTSASRSRISTS